MVKKKRNFSLDFIRTIACLMIIVFHFSIGNVKLYPEGIILKNYSLGNLAVSLFIILSGAALSLNYKKNTYKEYLIKRIKTIYPLFFICTLLFGIINFMYFPHIFDSVPCQRIIYTLLGIDGLLSYKFTTFNIVGEWYIGCIIILYLIYPFLKRLIDKFPKSTFIGLLVFYIVTTQFYCFDLSMDRNPIVRLFDFALGIYFVKLFIDKPFNNKKKLITFIISFILMCLSSFINTGINTMYCITIGGISIFLLLYIMADFVKNNSIKNVINIISKESYIIFLVHHQIQLLLTARFGADSFHYSRILYIFLIYLVFIIIATNLVHKIYDYIVKGIDLIKEKN